MGLIPQFPFEMQFGFSNFGDIFAGSIAREKIQTLGHPVLSIIPLIKMLGRLLNIEWQT